MPAPLALRSSVNKGRRQRRRANGEVSTNDMPVTNWKLYAPADPFPARFKTTLQFSYVGGMTVGATNTFGTEYVFRLNSVFAPSFTATTTRQPYGYDQLSGLYDRYFVRAVDVDVTFTDPSSDGLLVAAMVQPGSGATTLQGQSLRFPYEAPGCVAAPINNTGTQLARFHKKFTIAQIEGLKESELTAGLANFSAETDNSPTLVPWLRVATASYNATDSTSVCRFSIVLRYDVEFSSRVIQALS